jgi:DNA-binding CsgD family transcriptional regulator
LKLPSPPPPAGLTGRTLIVGKDEYAILQWPIPAKPDDVALSPAEADVMHLAQQGLSNAEIAKARNTSARTVANQLASVFRKLGIRSRLELYARRG